MKDGADRGDISSAWPSLVEASSVLKQKYNEPLTMMIMGSSESSQLQAKLTTFLYTEWLDNKSDEPTVITQAFVSAIFELMTNHSVNYVEALSPDEVLRFAHECVMIAASRFVIGYREKLEVGGTDESGSTVNGVVEEVVDEVGRAGGERDR